MLIAAYLSTARLAATSLIGDDPLFLVDFALRALHVVVILSLWRLLFGDAGQIAGVALPVVLTYSLMAAIVADQLTPRTNLEVELWQGTVGRRFLRPISLIGQLTAEMVGRWLPSLVGCSLPLFIAAPLFGVDPWPASAVSAALFGLSLILSITVGLAIDVISALITVALDQSPWAINYVRSSLIGLLSGAVIPLALWPWGLGPIIGWLPFASMASAPLQIYTGLGEAGPLLALQGLWSVGLWLLAAMVWRAQRERMVIYETA